jgi:hypothetical protein
MRQLLQLDICMVSLSSISLPPVRKNGKIEISIKLKNRQTYFIGIHCLCLFCQFSSA